MDELALIDEARAGDLNAFNHLVLGIRIWPSTWRRVCWMMLMLRQT